jgi:hypothetical protein
MRPIGILRSQPQISSNCPTPFFKRTLPQLSIMLRPHKVSAQIEQIGYSRMGTQKPLSLPY